MPNPINLQTSYIEWDFQICKDPSDPKVCLNLLLIRPQRCKINKESNSYKLLKTLGYDEFKIVTISDNELFSDTFLVSEKTCYNLNSSILYYPSIVGSEDPSTLSALVQLIVSQLNLRDLSEFLPMYKESFFLRSSFPEASLSIADIITPSELVTDIYE